MCVVTAAVVRVCGGTHHNPSHVCWCAGAGSREQKNERLVKKGSVVHSYPFCWRSDTPLIYRAVPSWFVNVTAIKDQLLANNEKT